MTPRDDSRRGWRRLFHDPWRKLASVVLAIGLWFFLDARVTEPRSMPCELRQQDLQWRETPFRNDSTPVLAVLLPLDEYAVKGFIDPITNTKVEQVTIHLQGAKRLISRLSTSEWFVVDSSSMKIDPDVPVFEFDIGDVQTREDDYQPLLDRMEPERVRVELERKVSTERLRLTPRMFTFTYGEGVQAMYDRIEVGGARFEPDAVVLRGRESFILRLEDDIARYLAGSSSPPTLFRVHLPTPPPTPTREIHQQLLLSPELIGKEITMDPPSVEVTIPVRPEYEEFELFVPVVLAPAGSGLDPDDFEPVEKQKVVLSAAGQLASELAVKKPDALQAWAAENTVVLAPLPKDAEPGKPIPIKGLFTFVKDTQYRSATDYKVAAVPVVATPKKDKQQGG